MTILTTNRLVLRPFEHKDAPALAELIGDWDVMKWLTSPPWPYALKDAEWFIGDRSSNGSFAITCDGSVMGAVGGPTELGYWLGQKYWGRGFMTEAAHAVVGHCFGADIDHMTSGYILGNGPSCAILTKLGFQNTHVLTEEGTPQGGDVQVQKMRLDRERWQRLRDAN